MRGIDGAACNRGEVFALRTGRITVPFTASAMPGLRLFGVPFCLPPVFLPDAIYFLLEFPLIDSKRIRII
jgi:hypothetical protein